MEDKLSDLVEQLKPNQTQQVQSMNYKFDLNTINSKENSEPNVEDFSRQLSFTSFSLTSRKGDISSLKEHLLRSPYLDRCKDEPDDNKNGIASNSFSKLSQPTLKPHPKAKNKLPPGPVSPVYQESVDSGGLSNESLFGNDTFERNLFTAFILDQTNDNHDDTKPNDDVWTTAPMFLRKTYQMISECEPDLAEWTLDGENFVVKDPTEFAQKVIPKFFKHCNFNSFARQLNYYGFHKVQVKPVRHTDIDKSKDKHVTFCNENFKRGRKELLSNIQRSTRGGGNNVNLNQQQRHIELLKTEGLSHEKQVMQLNVRMKLMEDKLSDLVEQLKPNQTQQVQSRNYKFDLNTINSKENSEANVEDL